jgi:pimeloyl-ACP methyl ester carboxylesterase
VADADLGKDAAETMRRMLCGVVIPTEGFDPAAFDHPPEAGFVDRLPQADELPDWLSQAELDHYAAEFTRTGFTGGLNWYRNFDRNWELTPQLAGAKITVPSAFITGSADPVNLMGPASLMDGWVEDHRGNTFVEGAGHWVQQQSPDEVNAALLTFIRSLDLGGR